MSDPTAVPTDDQDDENVKPLSAGDDFSTDTQNDAVNPEDAPLDAGVDQNYDDTEDDTLPPDEATNNPLLTGSGLEEVDDKVIPEEKNNLGDEVYNPLEDDEDDEE